MIWTNFLELKIQFVPASVVISECAIFKCGVIAPVCKAFPQLQGRNAASPSYRSLTRDIGEQRGEETSENRGVSHAGGTSTAILGKCVLLLLLFSLLFPFLGFKKNKCLLL